MDSEEAYEESRKRRTVNLSQLTKLYNELETKMISRDNMKTVKTLFTKLCDRYEQFKTAHLECLDLCTNSDIFETLEMNFDSSQKNFTEFRERFNEWMREPEIAKDEEDKNSRVTSVSRTSSSTQYRLKLARANRLKAEVQVKKMEEKQELERARREIEMKEQMLERKSQLEEAKLEESVWQEEEEEDTEVTFKNQQNINVPFNTENKTLNNKEHVTTKSTENVVSRIECTTAGSLQSSSSIDTAFQRLASTLQEGFNLPKPELLTFDGKPTDYCKFIKNFETNVECRVTDDQLKLSYLIQYCKGEAKSSIEDCVLLEKKGYERARSILHSRYGRSHMIVRSYIENLVYGAPIKASDFESLSKLALEMQKCEITLSQLGYVSDIDNTDNLRKIVKRLPMHLRVKWVDIAHSITENGREPRFSDLANFIDKKSRLASSMFGLDLVRENSNTYRKDIDKHTDMNTREKVSTFASNNMYDSKATTQDHKCICCNGTCNNLELCVKFKSMSLIDRVNFVRTAKLCFNCLKGKHFSRDCRKAKMCTVENCSSKHHILMHSWGKNNNTDHTATKVGIHCSSAGTVIKNCLGIIPVEVKGSNGKTCQTYALIDDGADKTLCDERLIKMLETESRPVTCKMTTATAQRVRHEGQEVDLHVQSVGSNCPITLSKVWSVKNLPISTHSAANNKDIKSIKHLSDIYIPEISSNKVLLLIGTDTPEAHIPIEVRSGSSHEPYAVRTRLGWIVRGPINNTSTSDVVNINFEHADNVLLQQQLERLWTTDFLDQPSTEKVCMSLEDKRALKTMESTIAYEDGHYKLGLPWRDENVKLPNNLPLAHARLNQLHRKLSHDPKLHEMYTATVSDYIQKGYAKEVTDVSNESSHIWYLPHHPVTNEHKPGKVRVVFDCAAKFKDVSLNSRLLQGPDFMNSLVGVLMRFRQDHIALAADIEAMFHQVRVKDDDCDALRFLWWPNGNLKVQPKCYQMQVHLFGATSSPSCAAYALKKTAIDNGELFETEIASTVERNFYVDDLLKSVDTEERAVQLATDLREIMKRGGFRLTKWLSNSKVVINEIPNSERAPSVEILKSNTALPTDRALGVIWDVNDDAIKYKVKLEEKPLTRRGITSTVSSIFDPLGLIAPIILKGKIILQDLSKQPIKLGWDDPIPKEKEEEWIKWKSTLPEIENISIPRCFKTKDMKEISDAQLHIFSDGSEIGYGACAYLRLVDTNGKVNCSLILGKSRLAPLKQTTIPRLELSGAVVACKLYEIIRDELEIKIDSVVFWTDSMIVLGYIKNESRRFKTFVANRLSSIHELTSPGQWRYVDTRSNPADIASRGILATENKQIKFWLHGPEFLLKDSYEWPKPKAVSTVDEQDIEIKRVVMINSTTTDSIRDIITYFSNWQVLQRTVAWLIRFKKYCIRRFLKRDDEIKTDSLNADELQEATRYILIHVQQESFLNEIKMIEKQNPVKKDSRLASLNPVMHDGLLRVKGRLNLSLSKCPVIIPNSHHVTTLIIRSFHEQNGHTGMAQVLASLREKYWILKGPSTVRTVLNSRRGIPEKVYSDNGTNLVSGESELRKYIDQWNKTKISSYMSHKDINWTFNPPNASHRGGVWERMIRTTRKILRALANEQLLTDEQLLTFMAEAERIVNDRPITAVSNDSRDLPVLTPNMLLLMKNNTSIPQGVFDEKDVYAKRWWKQIQYLANVFWRRWLREYLPTLQQRNKWQREQRDVKIDDIVIVADDHTSRGQWPLGRVIEVIRSRDSLIRSCVIKTKESKFLRPVTKLCILECSQ
ncbi:unnamed protein product [Mytilus edulis]|uniref:Integrase catalytic domain-containing protein n=1 Tax=Mytilus edulis TaxID=6550 RepID=A0A8S3V3U4_MYTED|nr:unnamed protein product [Mytilus edulis]